MYCVMDPKKTADVMQSPECEGEECRECANRQECDIFLIMYARREMSWNLPGPVVVLVSAKPLGCVVKCSSSQACMCHSHCVRCSFSPSFVCWPKQRFFPMISEISHDWNTEGSGDLFWWEISYPGESLQVTTEDAGHQVTGTKKEERVENEQMTQCLCSAFRLELMRVRKARTSVGSASIANLVRTSEHVVLLGNGKVGVLCNTHVVRCSFPPSFICWAYVVKCSCCARVARCSYCSSFLCVPKQQFPPMYPRYLTAGAGQGR